MYLPAWIRNLLGYDFRALKACLIFPSLFPGICVIILFVSEGRWTKGFLNLISSNVSFGAPTVKRTALFWFEHNSTAPSVASRDSSFQEPTSLVAEIRANTQGATKVVISQGKTLSPLTDGRVQFHLQVSLCTLVLLIKLCSSLFLSILRGNSFSRRAIFNDSLARKDYVRRCGFTHTGFAVPSTKECFCFVQ